MGFDGNGNWTSDFYPIQDRDDNIAILASKFQTLIQTNLKESFENCITRDGAGKPITNINWNGNKITNLQNGTSSADAVNKSQLDAVELSLDNEKVNRSGDTMTGDLTISKSLPTLTLQDTDNSTSYSLRSGTNGSLVLYNNEDGKGVYLESQVGYKPYYWNGNTGYQLLSTNDIAIDWSAGVAISSGTYVPASGIVRLTVSYGRFSSWALYVNNQLAIGYQSFDGTGSAYAGCVPVTVGDLITMGGNTTITFTFFPYKGV